MNKRHANIMRAEKDSAEQHRLERQMVSRVCHQLTGVCVMRLERKTLGDCTVDNCSAMRAAFANDAGD